MIQEDRDPELYVFMSHYIIHNEFHNVYFFVFWQVFYLIGFAFFCLESLLSLWVLQVREKVSCYFRGIWTFLVMHIIIDLNFNLVATLLISYLGLGFPELWHLTLLDSAIYKSPVYWVQLSIFQFFVFLSYTPNCIILVCDRTWYSS